MKGLHRRPQRLNEKKVIQNMDMNSEVLFVYVNKEKLKEWS